MFAWRTGGVTRCAGHRLPTRTHGPWVLVIAWRPEGIASGSAHGIDSVILESYYRGQVDTLWAWV